MMTILFLQPKTPRGEKKGRALEGPRWMPIDKAVMTRRLQGGGMKHSDCAARGDHI